MAILGGRGSRTRGPRGDWRAKLYPFRIKLDEGEFCLPAWRLGRLTDAELGAYTATRVIRIRIGNFLIRKPIRDVRHFAFDPVSGGKKPGDAGAISTRPTLPSQGGSRPTQLDVDVRPHMPASSKQRVLVQVLLEKGLEFFPEIEITAKTKETASRLVNLRVGIEKKEPIASFWVLSENGAGQAVEHGFNIGVVALDMDETSGLSLPVIIDPSVIARG
jgi:hypothetical protein